MYIVQIFVIFEIFGSVNCECSITQWLRFNRRGQSMCNGINYFMKGLIRGHNFVFANSISQLEYVECCEASQQWSESDVHVVYTDWSRSWDIRNTWALCPQGYFLQGLYRSDCTLLQCIKAARCAKPVSHPFYYGSCYEEDISDYFVTGGNGYCNERHYITGLYRADGDTINSLHKLKCCSMAEQPQVVNNGEGVIERIMETTLSNMANLADMLGYGNCLGKRGLNLGEDFERNENILVASKNLFWPDKECEGINCDKRLSLSFGDWSLAVKEISYGESVIDVLQPEIIDTGTRYNRDITSTTETFQLSKTIEETITHSATNSWTSSVGLGISIDFNLPFGVGSSSMSYNFRYDSSTSTTSEQSIHSSRELKISSTKTLDSNSYAKYNIIVYNTKTTIPYTAVMIAKFSTEFRGFMKNGGSYGSSDTNYHYQYSISSDTATVNYTFGSSTVPFYLALKLESESQSKPWLWNEMIRKNPTARQVIDSLTNETLYTFHLHGKLSKTAGTKIDVVWESVNLIGIHEVPDVQLVKVPNSNRTIKFVEGPNDPPPKDFYPKELDNSNQTFVPNGNFSNP